jgi:multimeric flavodoxin WrbA
MRIVIINGSLGGANGNTARLLASFQTHLTSTDVKVFHLSDVAPTIDDLVSADAFVFTTGVYWDSWGSPLQAFLEKATPLEGAPCWFGKPAAVIVTIYSSDVCNGVLTRKPDGTPKRQPSNLRSFRT